MSPTTRIARPGPAHINRVPAAVAAKAIDRVHGPSRATRRGSASREANRHRPQIAPRLAASPLEAPPTSFRYTTAQMPTGNSTRVAWAMWR